MELLADRVARLRRLVESGDLTLAKFEANGDDRADDVRRVLDGHRRDLLEIERQVARAEDALLRRRRGQPFRVARAA